MGFNYAIEKAKFEREWTQLRVEYEKAGMSTEKINILHDYDWENFKKERIYAIHTQEFREAQYDNGNSQEDKSPLFKKFLSAISRWDNYAASTSTGWIEDITDERLAARLKELSQEDLELLTQFIIQGFTQSDLEQMGYGKQYKISRRISRLKNFLCDFPQIIETFAYFFYLTVIVLIYLYQHIPVNPDVFKTFEKFFEIEISFPGEPYFAKIVHIG